MTLPSGSLNRIGGARDPALEPVETAALAVELLARLRAGQSLLETEVPVETYAVLAMELEGGLDVLANRFSCRQLSSGFGLTRSFPGSEQPPIEGATYVELGCGAMHPLGQLTVFVLLGVARAIGVDLDPPSDIASAARGIARCLSYMLGAPEYVLGTAWRPGDRQRIAERCAGFDFARLWQGDASGMDESRLELRTRSAAETGLESGSVDLVYSQAFLEHVPDVDAVLAEAARITKPGGFGVHTIDGADHRNYADDSVHRLEFLREDGSAAMVAGSNRVRPTAFLEKFERAGFEVVAFTPHERMPIPPTLRNSFVEPYRSLPDEDLSVISCAVHVRRR